MKFGYFDNQQKEYVIQRPDTPSPWMNYLGSQQFFGMISNTGGGYCFMVDSRKQRITRYRYNNVPMDAGGRYFYIRDEETGDFWSPSWLPVKKELDFYECRHGMGYTIITGEKAGIRVQTKYFVPVDDNLEIWEVEIRNTTQQDKTIKIFSLVEFCLWEALNDFTNLQRTLNLGEVEVEDNIIYHKTEYRERRQHFVYFAVSEPLFGFDTDLETFLGRYNGFHEPVTVRDGQPQNSIACGWNPCGSHCIQLKLKPGEIKPLNFLLGYFENPENEKFAAPNVLNKKYVKPIIQKYLQRSHSTQAFNILKADWDELLSHFQAESPSATLDTMVNIWNQYQCVITYNMARSASFYETGIGRGIGFRDACQDILGVVHIIPAARSRQRILDLAAIQWRNGDCYHQYQPLDKKGNADFGVGFNDDPLWLIIATAAYIKETGDWQILDEMVPFDNNPDDQAILFEHLKISFTYILNHLGPHKLPLIGRADWNDCLNLIVTRIKPGDTFQADASHADLTSEIGRVPESLMIAAQFVWAGQEFTLMAAQRGDQSNSEQAEKAVNEMIQAIYKAGWDGQWFLRAYDRFGNKIGSHENKDGQIFIEPQAFMGIAGVGKENGLLMQAMDSLHERLYSKHGVILQQPAFTEYNFNIGEITSYPPGVKENAGIFCHPNGWVVIAECNLGRGEQALRYYLTICPAAREEISEIHRCEPYVYCQMIAGPDSPRFGEGKNSWLTGTASANFLGVSQYILGVKPDFDGLRIDPCLPGDWRTLRLKRKYRNALYDIVIHNPTGVCKGVQTVIVDNKELKGNLLPAFNDGQTHTVEVILGK